MYTIWTNLTALRSARWPLGGGTAISRWGEAEGRDNRGGRENVGTTDGDGKRLTGMINIVRETDEGRGRGTGDGRTRIREWEGETRGGGHYGVVQPDGNGVTQNQREN